MFGTSLEGLEIVIRVKRLLARTFVIEEERPFRPDIATG